MFVGKFKPLCGFFLSLLAIHTIDVGRGKVVKKSFHHLSELYFALIVGK